MELTYKEKRRLLTQEHGGYINEVENMVKRKFYNQKNRIEIEYNSYKDYYHIKIYLKHVGFRIKFITNNSEYVYFKKIVYNIYDRKCITFDDICLNSLNKNYYSSYEIIDNIIICDSLSKFKYEEIQKHLDLNYINKICQYVNKKLHLMETTHYLSHLKAAKTLILVNKRMSSPIPFDVLKIIIEKI